MSDSHQPYRDNGDKEPLYRRTSELAKLAPKVAKVGAYGALAFATAGIACFFEGYWALMRASFALAILCPMAAAGFSTYVQNQIQADPSLVGSHYTKLADAQIERVGNMARGLWRFVGGLFFVAVVGVMLLLGSR